MAARRRPDAGRGGRPPRRPGLNASPATPDPQRMTMTEFISRQDWLRLEIDAADHYVERHGADDDPIQRAHAQRRGREAAKHRAELARLHAPTGAATSPATTATSPRDQTNPSDA